MTGNFREGRQGILCCVNLFACWNRTLAIVCSAESQSLYASRRREETERVSRPYLGTSAIALLYDQGKRQCHLL